MYAGHGAVRGAGFLCDVFAADIGSGVAFQRSPRVTALLGAVMHQAVFANVEIARACAASPLIWTTLSDVVLESIDAGEAALFHGLNFVVNATFFFSQWLYLSAAVVDDADS